MNAEESHVRTECAREIITHEINLWADGDYDAENPYFNI